ncbi:MAG: nodulation protein NfeD [Rhodothermaceae bacterium]|nr:hypothetical protein [Bacteroidota bacterium]MXW15080.1 nodulation protein NfeD [Rhodothermaceae bacterium]MXW32089.1 nodulation protein NfeD [Rhodothermaceae bacterium]MXX97743.1 nodulation protein NfeD [Rhodothermaceae bacterium]MXZ18145.1 nodulation protein NfeD [Rhodothermaceae bacterium]
MDRLFTLLMLSLFVPATLAQVRAPKPLELSSDSLEGPVFVVPVNGMIDNGLARYIDRAVRDATNQGAVLTVFEIDTFGGLVDAADKIRKTLLDAEMSTVAFIDKNAASAGALISYAADRIVMVPGASIGAATVVEGVGGDEAPDKYQSYMRGLMRSTAEANGRDPQIAESMVDPSLEVEGVSEKGKVLTLSATEALEFGVADQILGTTDAVIAAYGLDSPTLVAHRETTAERVLRFLGSPVVQSILMLMMLGGLYFELQTPGVGFPGAVALLGIALFFAPHYLLGLVEVWEILLFILGVGLIIVELFVFPGFGIAGISGLVLVLFSLVAALIGNVGFSFPPIASVMPSVYTLAVTMAILAAGLIMAVRVFPTSATANVLVLAPELRSSEGYTTAMTHSEYIGRVGPTVTDLRPSGVMLIDKKRVDVITAGEYIDRGTQVQVVDVRGTRIEVRTHES